MRYFGWVAAKTGKRVYITDCWKWPDNPDFAIDWSTFDDPSVLLIVENAHAKASAVEDLLGAILNHSTKLNLLVSADPSIDSLLPQRPYYLSPILNFPGIHLRGGKFSAALIDRYAAKFAKPKIGETFRAQLLKGTSDGERGGYWKIGEGFGDVNLWLLAARLKDWNAELPVPWTQLSRDAENAVTGTILTALKSRPAADAALALSVALFSYYHVAVPKGFVINELGFSEAQLEELTTLGFLQASESGVLIQDHAIAKLLMEMFDSKSEAELDLSKRLDSNRPACRLIETALLYGLPDYDMLCLNMLAFERKGRYRSSSPLSFRYYGLDETVVKAALEKLIASDKRAGHVGRALLAASGAKVELRGSQAFKGADHFAEIASQRDVSTKEFAWLVQGLRKTDSDVCRSFLELVDLKVFSRLIQEEPDIGKVGSLILSVAGSNRAVATRIGELCSDAKLYQKVNAERDISKVGWLLQALAEANPNAAQKMAEGLDIEKFRTHTRNVTATSDLALFFSGLGRASRALGSKTVGWFSEKELEERIKTETDARSSGLLLRALAENQLEQTRKVVSGIPQSHFGGIISGEEDSESLAILLGGLQMAAPEYAKALAIPEVTDLAIDEAHANQVADDFSARSPTIMWNAIERRDRSRYRILSLLNSPRVYPRENFLKTIESIGAQPLPLPQYVTEVRKSRSMGKREREGVRDKFRDDLSPAEVVWRSYWDDRPYVLDIVRREGWQPMFEVLRRPESTFEVQCKLAIILAAAERGKFKAELEKGHAGLSTGCQMEELISGLKLGMDCNSDAPILLYEDMLNSNSAVIEKAIEHSDMQSLIDYLDTLSRIDDGLANRAVKAVSTSKLVSLIEDCSEEHLAKLLGICYLVAPGEVHRIPQRTLSGLEFLSDVCRAFGSFWEQSSLKPDLQTRTRALTLLLRDLKIADAIHSSEDLREISYCLRVIRLYSASLAEAVAKELDGLAVAKKISSPSEDSFDLLEELIRSDKAVVTHIWSIIVDGIHRGGSYQPVNFIESVHAFEPTIGQRLAGEVTTEELAKWVVEKPAFGHMASLINRWAKIAPQQTLTVLAMGEVDQALKAGIGKERDLRGLVSELQGIAGLNFEMASRLSRNIPEDVIDKGFSDLSGLSFSVEDGCGVAFLAILYPEKFKEKRGHFFAFLEKQELDELDYACDFLDQLFLVSPDVYREFCGGLSELYILKLCALGKEEGQEHRGEIHRLMAMVYRADPERLTRMIAQNPDLISSELIESFRSSPP